MADKMGIRRTGETWNPLAGCSIVSPGCTNCHAMAQAARIVRGADGFGCTTHYADTVKTVNGKAAWTGEIRMAPDRVLTEPLRWRRPLHIFVNSMSDLFHESVPDEWIDRIFAVMALCPQHTFQVLTKRPERMRDYMDGLTREAKGLFNPLACARLKRAAEFVVRNIPGRQYEWAIGWPLPNLWLGVTAERQQEADERIPIMLATPAAKRFVSIEPTLGLISLRHRWRRGGYDDWLTGERWFPGAGSIDSETVRGGPRLDWVICGGESGPKARPMHPDWARSLRDQCDAAGVPFFFKQWGEWAPVDRDHPGRRLHVALDDGTFATDLTAYDPETATAMMNIGKHAAGRHLDGVTHDAFPEG